MENNNQQPVDKLNEILERIKTDDIKIKPKILFKLKLLALVLVIFATTIVSFFLSSLIIFTIRATGQASIIDFGPTGPEVFLRLFPWTLFAAEIGLIFALEWLLRSFRFAYKIPVLYLFVGVIIFMTVVGVIADRFRVHDNLMRISRPSSFGRVYDKIRRPPPMGHGIHRGSIAVIGTSTLTVLIDNTKNASATLMQVLLPPRFNSSFLSPEDHIFIRGPIVEEKILAKDIRKAPFFK